MMSPKTSRNLKLLAAMAMLSGLFGILMSARFSKESSPGYGLVGFFVGASIGFLCAAGNFFLLPRLERWPFTLLLFVKTVYFTAVTSGVIYLRLVFWSPLDEAGQNATVLLYSVLITLGISFVVSMFLMLYRMLGQNALMNFFTGRYHRPKEEERIFMFLDIASSTTIAEKIGHRRFLGFLNDFIYDITDAILASGGEIYKYVGDEIIVVWKVRTPERNTACLTCFFEIERLMEERAGHYLKKCGFVPKYRAGLHCGRVVVGEMGDFKREIAFLGDTVNTTARVQEAAKKHGRDLLISSDLIGKISMPGEWRAESLGEVTLRGKELPLELFGVSAVQPVSRSL